MQRSERRFSIAYNNIMLICSSMQSYEGIKFDDYHWELAFSSLDIVLISWSC